MAKNYIYIVAYLAGQIRNVAAAMPLRAEAERAAALLRQHYESKGYKGADLKAVKGIPNHSEIEWAGLPFDCPQLIQVTTIGNGETAMLIEIYRASALNLSTTE